jgi:putative ABC transport system ATP-binding protein
MDEKVIIQTDNLCKVYGQGDISVHALIDVDLRICENEFVAIMGPSGSGKSTLMNILGCLDTPTSGCYCLAGEDVSSMDKKKLAQIRNQRIGFIFQSFNLLAQTSALDNVVLPLQYRREHLLTDAEQKELGIQALNTVGLGDRLHHKPNELSGGQVQRVAVARALINDPVLVLADEPTGNLDTHSSVEIMTLLSELHHQGRTIVMVTHSDEISAYAQRIIHFRDGRIDTDFQNGNSMTEPVLQEASDEI